MLIFILHEQIFHRKKIFRLIKPFSTCLLKLIGFLIFSSFKINCLYYHLYWTAFLESTLTFLSCINSFLYIFFEEISYMYWIQSFLDSMENCLACCQQSFFNLWRTYESEQSFKNLWRICESEQSFYDLWRTYESEQSFNNLWRTYESEQSFKNLWRIVSIFLDLVIA